MMLARQQGSPNKAGVKVENLEKTAETLELALSRLTPSEKEVKMGFVCVYIDYTPVFTSLYIAFMSPVSSPTYCSSGS